MVARLAVVAILAGLLGAAFPSVLFGDRTLSAAAWAPGVLPSGPVGSVGPPSEPAPMRDVEGAAWVDEPAPYLVRRGLDRGAVLWNDAEGLGIPLLGNPNMGALAPLQLPVNLAPSPRVQDLAWLMRALLLGVFTFGLAREIGARRLGAMAAAISLMLSGQTVEWIEHHPLNTDVFVPAALWAALALRRSGRRGVAVLALAVAAGLLGVKPQSAVVAGLFGLLWLVAAWRDRAATPRGGAPAGPGHAWREMGAVGGGVLLGAGLAAVALVPFAQTYDQASGLVRAGRSTQSEWTLPPASLPSLGGALAVDLQRLAHRRTPRVAATPPGLPYAGLTVVIAAGLGLWCTRGSWLSWALALTAALEVLRIHGFLAIPLSGVPILGGINYVKYCFPLYLALALLAARGIDALPAPGAALAVALVGAELLWLVPRVWAQRVDPYAPAPWVVALRELEGQRPGRMSGDVHLAPPLVSNALGLRDLRSIDVLTPEATFDFVSRLVAPSQGVTWILADPDPLLAATGPGADLADLRWIVATSPLSASDLPAATRAGTAARRLSRLLAALETYHVDTRQLGGGIHDDGRDRRFHWTCQTPCRFSFSLAAVPGTFVAGIAAPAPVDLSVRLGTRDGPAPSRSLSATSDWSDLWLAAGAEAGRPGTIVLEIDGATPETVFVGGVGPAPGPEEEMRLEQRELSSRAEAFERLELRWQDEEAWIYENVGALGEAVLAQTVVGIPPDDPEAPWECVSAHPGQAVACLSDSSRALPASAEQGGTSPGLVHVRASAPDRLLAEVEARRSGPLLISRAWSPGWDATVDGAPAAIARSAGALMAVEVPPGRHRVELVYAPRSLHIGLAVTLVSVVILVVLVGAGGRGHGAPEAGGWKAGGGDRARDEGDARDLPGRAG